MWVYSNKDFCVVYYFSGYRPSHFNIGDISSEMLCPSAATCWWTNNLTVTSSGLDSVESNGKSKASICSENSYWLNTKLNILGIGHNRYILDLKRRRCLWYYIRMHPSESRNIDWWHRPWTNYQWLWRWRPVMTADGEAANRESMGMRKYFSLGNLVNIH